MNGRRGQLWMAVLPVLVMTQTEAHSAIEARLARSIDEDRAVIRIMQSEIKTAGSAEEKLRQKRKEKEREAEPEGRTKMKGHP